MAFTEVSWTDNDIVTEAKLDAMVASDVFLRDELNFKHYVSQIGAVGSGDATQSSTTVVINIDGASITTNVTTTGESIRGNVDISAISDGLHSLNIVCATASIASEFRFVKTPGIDYLTIWLSLSSTYTGEGLTYTKVIYNLTVIGHRELQSWTV